MVVDIFTGLSAPNRTRSHPVNDNSMTGGRLVSDGATVKVDWEIDDVSHVGNVNYSDVIRGD
jgi:hypothetical protein